MHMFVSLNFHNLHCFNFHITFSLKIEYCNITFFTPPTLEKSNITIFCPRGLRGRDIDRIIKYVMKYTAVRIIHLFSWRYVNCQWWNNGEFKFKFFWVFCRCYTPMWRVMIMFALQRLYKFRTKTFQELKWVTLGDVWKWSWFWAIGCQVVVSQYVCFWFDLVTVVFLGVHQSPRLWFLFFGCTSATRTMSDDADRSFLKWAVYHLAPYQIWVVFQVLDLN